MGEKQSFTESNLASLQPMTTPTYVATASEAERIVKLDWDTRVEASFHIADNLIRFLLGTKGKIKSEIETLTGARIFIPSDQKDGEASKTKRTKCIIRGSWPVREAARKEIRNALESKLTSKKENWQTWKCVKETFYQEVKGERNSVQDGRD